MTAESAFYDRALRRIDRLALALSVLLIVGMLVTRGRREAFGCAIGAVLSYLNLLLWKRAANAVAPDRQRAGASAMPTSSATKPATRSHPPDAASGEPSGANQPSSSDPAQAPSEDGPGISHPLDAASGEPSIADRPFSSDPTQAPAKRPEDRTASQSEALPVDAPHAESSGSSSAALYGLRYLLLGGVVFVIIKYFEVSFLAVLAGLLVSVAAIILEILYELIFTSHKA